MQVYVPRRRPDRQTGSRTTARSPAHGWSLDEAPRRRGDRRRETVSRNEDTSPTKPAPFDRGARLAHPPVKPDRFVAGCSSSMCKRIPPAPGRSATRDDFSPLMVARNAGNRRDGRRIHLGRRHLDGFIVHDDASRAPKCPDRGSRRRASCRRRAHQGPAGFALCCPAVRSSFMSRTPNERI